VAGLNWFDGQSILISYTAGWSRSSLSIIGINFNTSLLILNIVYSWNQKYMYILYIKVSENIICDPTRIIELNKKDQISSLLEEIQILRSFVHQCHCTCMFPPFACLLYEVQLVHLLFLAIVPMEDLRLLFHGVYSLHHLYRKDLPCRRQKIDTSISRLLRYCISGVR
jgi:hypothetical protein